MYNVLTQAEAPDYFNNSMKALQNISAPLDKLDALVGTVNSIMITLQHVQSEATEAKNTAKKAQSEIVVLSNKHLEMKRKFAHLETKHNSLGEKIVDQENYNRRENRVFEGIHESRGENLQVIMINLFRDMGVVFPEQIQVVRCHQLAGSHLSPKPIIIRFQWFQDR